MKLLVALSILVACTYGIPTAKKGTLRPTLRIVGGQEVIPNSLPYQVGLVVKSEGHFHSCGASILSNDYLLTAAHCVEEAEFAKVKLGSHNTTEWKPSGEIEILTHEKDWIIHPDWDSSSVVNDIALIRLPESIAYTEKIKPINLPKRSEENSNFDGFLPTASGWGRFSDESRYASDVLRFVKVPIMPNEECSRYYPYTIKPTNICTRGDGKMSPCEGDSGGPLSIDEEDGTKTIIGVVSMVSASGCESGGPAIYTRVTSYLDWISKVTGITIV